jgi:succinoglycan biosynthesis transport protein ExoP
MPTPSYRQPAPESAAADLHISDYLALLYRQRRVALIAMGSILGAAILYLVSATRLYEATAQLEIEADSAAAATAAAGETYQQTQYRILQSRAIARKAMDAAKLWDRREFMPEGAGGGDGPSEEARSRAVDRFLSGLNIAPIRTSHLVNVKYLSPDPALAAQAANAVVNVYLAEHQEVASKSTLDLDAQIANQRVLLQAAEAAAAQRARTPAPRKEIIDDQASFVLDITTSLRRARTERLLKESTYSQLTAAEKAGRVESLPAVAGNPAVQQLTVEVSTLQSQYTQLAEDLGENHPALLKARVALQAARDKLRAQTARVVETVRAEYLAAVDTEQSLTRLIAQQRDQLLALNERIADDDADQKAVVAAKTALAALQKQRDAVAATGGARTRLVDAAEPPSNSIYPQTMNVLLLASVLAPLLGIVFAFGTEYLDSRLKRPEEVSAYLRLPTLAVIPMVPGTSLLERRQFWDGTPMSFNEGIKVLCANLMANTPSADPAVSDVLVTSTTTGEGKTTIAASLAATMARRGHRVLLVDADMRRPALHQLFAQPQAPGLAEVLAGRATAAAVIHDTGVDGLSLLTAGQSGTDALDLLQSVPIRTALAARRDRYDWVVIDSPPAGDVADAVILANQVSAVVYVVASELTSRRHAQRAVAQLSASTAAVVGALVNRADTLPIIPASSASSAA